MPLANEMLVFRVVGLVCSAILDAVIFILLAAFGVGFEVLVGACTARFLPWYRRDERSK
jgi:hypothetical protein